jgi:hypothetical protein
LPKTSNSFAIITPAPLGDITINRIDPFIANVTLRKNNFNVAGAFGNENALIFVKVKDHFSLKFMEIWELPQQLEPLWTSGEGTEETSTFSPAASRRREGDMGRVPVQQPKSEKYKIRSSSKTFLVMTRCTQQIISPNTFEDLGRPLPPLSQNDKINICQGSANVKQKMVE